MKYWIYTEPATEKCMAPVYTILSEIAILAQYFEYWSGNMRCAGKHDLISPERCIEDWVALHYAVLTTKDNLEKLITE